MNLLGSWNMTMYVTDFELVTSSTVTSTPSPLDDSNVRSDVGITYNHRLIFASCVCVIMLVGLLGNGLVIASVIVAKKLHTITNILVVNLAVADFVTCCIIPFLVIGLVDRSNEYPLPEIICSIVTGVLIVCMEVSIATISVIAFVRWYVITKSIRGHHGIHTPRKIIITGVVIWLMVTALVAVPLSLGVGEVGYSRYYSLCSVTDTNPLRAYFVLLQSGFILMNLFITGMFYSLIAAHVTRQTRQFRKQFADDGPASKYETQNAPKKDHLAINAAFMKREVEITKNLFIVVCIFVLCFLPTGVNYAIPGPSVFTLYGALFSVANSATNPIIYGLKHPNFQQVFKSLLLCRSTDTL